LSKEKQGKRKIEGIYSLELAGHLKNIAGGVTGDRKSGASNEKEHRRKTSTGG